MFTENKNKKTKKKELQITKQLTSVKYVLMAYVLYAEKTFLNFYEKKKHFNYNGIENVFLKNV